MQDYNAVLYDLNVKLFSYTLFFLWNCRKCSRKVLLFVFSLSFVFFSFTAAHFYRVAGRWHFSFSHHSYEILMFFFQRNSSPLFLITRSSSFSVIHESEDIKNNVEKDSTLLLFFLSKSPGGHAISRQNTSSCLWCGRTDGRSRDHPNFSDE